MILKIVMFFVILIVSYGATVFVSPGVASSIDSALGIPGFSETLRGGKETFDGAITDIPSLNEVRSGALDAKEKFLEGVDTTKETIDSVRGGAQKAEETYNDAKETFDSAKNTFDSAKQTFDDLSGKVEQVQGVVEDVQNISSGGE